jgi:hypothetical protein
MKKIYVVSLVSILMACQQQPDRTTETTADSNLKTEVAADTLTYTYDSVKVYSKTPLSSNKQVTDTAKAVVSYPVFSDTKINALVQENALYSDNPDQKKPDSYQDIVKNFIDGFDNFKKGNETTIQTWFKDIDIKVLPQWNNYLGFAYSFVEYVGGAHMNSGLTYKNYNAQTLKLQTTDSLVKPGAKPELTKIGEQIFRKNEKLSATQNLDNYFFDKGIFVLPENFKLSQKGITFLYNSYEIKPYSSGRTELFIPFEDIKHILQPNPILPAIK